LQRLESLKLRHFTAEIAFLKPRRFTVRYPTQLFCWNIVSPLSSMNSSDTDSCRKKETRTHKQTNRGRQLSLQTGGFRNWQATDPKVHRQMSFLSRLAEKLFSILHSTAGRRCQVKPTPFHLRSPSRQKSTYEIDFRVTTSNSKWHIFLFSFIYLWNCPGWPYEDSWSHNQERPENDDPCRRYLDRMYLLAIPTSHFESSWPLRWSTLPSHKSHYHQPDSLCWPRLGGWRVPRTERGLSDSAVSWRERFVWPRTVLISTSWWKVLIKVS